VNPHRRTLVRVITCAHCGAENPDGFRFCGSCGSPLGAEPPEGREERKVVTVLFADLAGFTGKAERLDPEDVRAMLSPYYARLRERLEAFGGTVEKFIGDAVVGLFGAPIAHEDDPERAVRAALAIRDAVGELNEGDSELDLHVRIGVNTGEALVALGARPIEGEGMASGDVVNTAARLQAAAPIDGILVGELTYRSTAGVIEYRETDPVTAKGKAEPVAAWEPLQARARLGVDVVRQARTALVGRERELEVLAGALARAREERSPQLVTLVGEPGIGKSRLVAELLQIVERDPDLIFWRQGRSLPYGEGVSFWALGEMVKGQAGILETDRDEDAEAKLHAAVGQLFTDEEDAAWVERHLRPLVGLAGEQLRDDRQAEAFAAWRRFLEALAERSPTVLVFEDLHWADDGLLDFIDHLVEWAGGVPLLVICTARPELLARRAGWGGGKPNAVTLSLSPLSGEETARLLSHLLERAVLPAEVHSALLSRAGGNPLYAEEFARMAAERDLLSRPEALPLPESVQGIIAARLDGLSGEEKALLQDASVIGKVFWLGAVASVGNVDRHAAEQVLHRLERRQFVRRDRRSSVAGETEYAFWHLLVGDVAYGQIPRARRAEKHRLAAEWTAALAADRVEDRAEMLAHHYRAALEFSRAAGQDVTALEAPARQALFAAGERAMALNAFGAAERFYADAVALTDPADPQRPHLLFRHGRALWLHTESGQDVLAEARDGLMSIGEVEPAAEAEIMIGDLIWHEARRDAAFERFERARELIESLPTSASKAWVVAHVSRFQMLAGRNEEAIALGKEALEMAEALGLANLRATCLNNIGVARVAAGDRDGLREIEASIAIAEQVSSPWDEARGYLNLASVVGYLGDLRRCRELHERATEISRRHGLETGIRFLRAERCLDLYHAGEWEEALKMADEFIAEVEVGSAHYMESACRFVRAWIRLARGRVDEALTDGARAVEVARDAKDPQALHPTLGEYARLLLLAGRLGDAERFADEVLELAAVEKDQLVRSQWIVPVAFVLAESGRPDEALAEADNTPLATPWADAARAVAQGDLPEAADVMAQIGALSDEAYARLLGAERLMVEGREQDAQDQLSRALAFYRSVGATGYVRRGEALLASTA
jgi:class 3 adenylate cyclase/tetratricopeptide (TPR) repeat protein